MAQEKEPQGAVAPAGHPKPVEVRELPIETVYAEPQLRQSIDDEGIDELSASIGNFGLLEVIGVQPRPGGLYSIIYGERRYRALLRAGATTIPALVWEGVDRKQVPLLQLIENSARRGLNPIEMAVGIREVKDLFGWNDSEMERYTGLKRSTLREYQKMLRLAPELRERVAAREMPVMYAKYAAELARSQQLATLHFLDAVPHPAREHFRTLCRLLKETEGGIPEDEERNIERVLQREIRKAQRMLGTPPEAAESEGDIEEGVDDEIAESVAPEGSPPAYFPEHPRLPDVPRGGSLRARLRRYIEELSESPDPEHRQAALVLGKLYNALPGSNSVNSAGRSELHRTSIPSPSSEG